jgi:tyrosyl-tRNA synthetase
MPKRKPVITKSVEEQLEVIRRRTVEIVPEDLLVKKLERSLETQTPLIVKQGFDPTAPDIHLGHTVGLRKLRQFQDLGHQVVFLVGDFTGLIGDPSGRSRTRNRMEHKTLLDNAKTYTEQAFKILNPKKTVIDFNSRWLSKLAFAEVLELTATQTVAQLIERDDFNKRFNSQKPISLLEFVYPLAQGYDSVALKADVEIGGTDQTFNLLMARDIQRQYGQEPQVILTLPILEGIDGVEKMSKSLDNYIGITEPAEEIYGKTMSIPDEVIVKYFELVSSYDSDGVRDVQGRLDDPATNPSHVKRELARDIVALFYDEEASLAAEERFNKIHVQKDRPDKIERLDMKPEGGEDGVWIVKALTKSDLCESSSAARRMIKQGAVRVDGKKTSDIDLRLAPRKSAYTIKVGKRRFIEIVVK